jgi:hypothetical protein
MRDGRCNGYESLAQQPLILDVIGSSLVSSNKTKQGAMDIII